MPSSSPCIEFNSVSPTDFKNGAYRIKWFEKVVRVNERGNERGNNKK
ncbi:hypothetical protein HPHPH34_0071 [Helicobacter pylori Hp H-34]|uniref:Uncharacterized protein n=1 Tax=Helicobacter pylori Hp H-34 TaxID=992069 RepID=I9W0H6_HELPX|nr:hypothetical protein HPHPH34_0071 [Helicobacter pylori Hp H-34]